MEATLDRMAPFFRNPNKGFLIRELAKITGVNHMTARKFVLTCVKQGLVIKRKGELYDSYAANTESRAYLNLKLYFNLELIRKSGIVETLEREFHYPTLKVFGSFARGLDTERSDVDICMITNVKKKVDLEPFHQIIGRKISIHQFTTASWNRSKRQNQNLLNNIADGITLSGQVEFL